MITEENIVRDAARLIVWYPVRWCISALPIPVALRTFMLMGNIHAHLSRAKRRLLYENFSILPDQTKKEFPLRIILKRYFQVHYLSQLLVFLFPRLTKPNIERIHSFEGMENLHRELSHNKGCILLHPHFGPVHLPLFHFGLDGHPVKQLGYLRRPKGLSRIGEKVAFRLRQKYEGMIPCEIIQADRFLSAAFEHVRKNGILMMTGDGTGRGEAIGKFADFTLLGRKKPFPLGPARLALKTGASIIPMFTIKEAGASRFITRLEEPIFSAAQEAVSDEEEITGRFVRVFESYLKKHPYQWHFWDEFPVFARLKTDPPPSETNRD